jgi:F-type H+-transporting ATPase subunit delta
MSSQDRIVKAYTKSLFQNALNLESINETSNLLNLRAQQFFPPVLEEISNVFIIGEELLLFRSLFLNSEKMRTIFKNPILPEKQKMSILFAFFPGTSRITCSFLKILAEKSQLSLLPKICEDFNEMLSKHRKIAKVTLYISSPLEDEIGLKFLEILKELTSTNEIILGVVYSPKLLAGLILEYNSISINASILSTFKVL